jgi:3-oxoacyl-[acyl-carrier-protein] synthase III
MSFISTPHVKIGAVAACVPTRIVTTKSYELFNPQELKLFQMGTGVFERRFVDQGTCASDLCYEAAKKILDSNLVHPEEIDILIFVSQSPDYILPASSMVLHKRLGLGKQVLAFDLNLGCSGYVYGLSVLSSLLSQSNMRKGLLLCGDASSPSLSFEDKSTYPLFGDAGSATLLVREQGLPEMAFNLQTDGTGFESIIIPGGATRNPLNDKTFVKKVCEDGNTRSPRDLYLNGVDVFNFALREVKTNIETLLQNCAVQIEDLDYVVMHQANKLINESVRKKMKVPADKVPYSIDKFGNTSSASIPLTIVHALKDSLVNPKKILLSGFGVGYSWGSVYMNSSKIEVLPLIEYDLCD